MPPVRFRVRLCEFLLLVMLASLIAASFAMQARTTDSSVNSTSPLKPPEGDHILIGKRAPIEPPWWTAAPRLSNSCGSFVGGDLWRRSRVARTITGAEIWR